MNAALQAPDMQLAWSSSFDVDHDFKRILRILLAIFVVFAVAVPFIPIPEIKRVEKAIVPPQLAKVILGKRELPKPEKIKPKAKPKSVTKVQPKPVEKPKPKPVVTPKPVQRQKQAREVASASGLLQFKDDLAAMRDDLDLTRLNNNLSKGSAEASRVERSVISSRAGGASNGITTASLSRNTGGSALSGRETTTVTSPVTSGVQGKSDVKNGRDMQGRSDEEIRKVMDRSKGVIFAIYNRALRSDPGLEGKVTVQLIIEASGAVSSVKLIASELHAPVLEKKLLARIKLINFGAAPVARTTLNYSFDFLPY